MNQEDVDLLRRRVQEMLIFDFETGVVRWRKPPTPRVKEGDIAGTVYKRRSVRYITLDGRKHLEHRLIWLAANGSCPATIKHVNGDSLDNRLVNLRDSDRGGEPDAS